jgi:capsular exopolysaccharide synthesis family protein
MLNRNNSNNEIVRVTNVSAPLSTLDAAVYATGARDIDPQNIWRVLKRRRTMLLAIWVAFALFVAAFTLLQPKKYTTQVKMIAGNAGTGASANTQTNAGTNLPILNALLAANGVQSSETYAELLQQTPVAQEVARRLGLNIGAADLLGHLQVKPVTDTAILALNVTWKDPVMSAQIANTFAAVFVDHERDLVAHQADSAISFLQAELPDAERKMRDTQEALSAYQVQTGIADLPTQTANSELALAALDTKQQSEQLDAAQAQAQLATIQSDIASTPPTIVGTRTVGQNPVSGQLETQISSLQVQLNTARQQYTDSYPVVVALKAQLAAARRQEKTQPDQVVSGVQSIPNPVYQALTQTAATLRATTASALAEIKTIDSQRKAEQPKLDKLPIESRRIGDLQRTQKSAEGVYDALQQKYQDAVITKTTALSDVAITANADPNVYHKTPNTPFNIALGIIVGLVLAVTAVFLAEFFDDRFRTEEEVKERLGLPVLATIPMLESGSAREEWVKPLSVESFYQLVASLRYSSASPPRTIAFTSATQGDGKSTVAMNTAISMGLMNASVLIIDADLRRPSIHHKMHVSNDRGLSDVLVGVARFQDAILPTEHAKVFVLPSGRSAPNPVGLLQGEAFERLLRQAREQFDYVLIDAPALRSIVDGVVLGIKAEGTVLVVSATQSDARSVKAAIAKMRSVDGINLLGVVLNATRPDRRETSADYYLGGGQTIALPAEKSG